MQDLPFVTPHLILAVEAVDLLGCWRGPIRSTVEGDMLVASGDVGRNGLGRREL